VFTDTPQAKAHVEASQAAQQHQQRRYDDATMTLYRMKHHPRVARACAWLEAFGIDPYVEPIGGHYMRHHFEGHHTEVSIRWISECLSAAAEKLTSAR
jgi:hypothetical protein